MPRSLLCIADRQPPAFAVRRCHSQLIQLQAI